MQWLIAMLEENTTLLIASAVSFVAGAVFIRMVSGRDTARKTGEDPRNHRIRELEADLRLAQRRLEEYTDQLETKTREVDDSMATVHDLNALLEERQSEVEVLRGEVKGAVQKTRELRRELTDRAEETLREHVRAKEAQTELEVVRAGSDALVSEFTRVQQESDERKDD